MNKKIQVYVPHFFPASDSIGPAKSVLNLMIKYYSDAELVLNSSDRDLSGRLLDQSACTPESLGFNGSLNYLGKTDLFKHYFTLFFRPLENDKEYFYFNSLFSLQFTIIPLSLLLCRTFIFGQSRTKILIAPRGELYPAALLNKSLKKKFALSVMRFTLKESVNVCFHASCEEEAGQIVQQLSLIDGSRVITEIDVPDQMTQIGLTRTDRMADNRLGRLRLLYFSKILPKKNLNFLTYVFEQMDGSILETQITFSIAGPPTDSNYAQQCIGKLKSIFHEKNAPFFCLGEINSSHVSALLESHDVLLFPTLGENFGHVVFEALDHGLVVLTSKATPWNNEPPALYCLDTTDPSEWCKILQEIIQNWASSEYRRMVSESGHIICCTFNERNRCSNLFNE